MARRKTTTETKTPDTTKTAPTRAAKRQRAQPATMRGEQKSEPRIEAVKPEPENRDQDKAIEQAKAEPKEVKDTKAQDAKTDPTAAAQSAAASALSHAAKEEPTTKPVVATEAAPQAAAKSEPAAKPDKVTEEAAASRAAARVAEPVQQNLQNAVEAQAVAGSVALQGLQATVETVSTYQHEAALDYQNHFKSLAQIRGPADLLRLQTEFVGTRTESLMELNIRLTDLWREAAQRMMDSFRRAA